MNTFLPKELRKRNMLELGRYRHYSGREYRVIAVAKHSETFEDVVVYEALYKNELGKYWVRPLAMFIEEVIVDGTSVPRFTLIAAEQMQTVE